MTQELHPDALITLAAKGATFEVEMHLNGEFDHKNPAHSMLSWLADNWDGLLVNHNAAAVRTASDAIQGVEEAKIVTPTPLKLVNASGTSLIHH